MKPFAFESLSALLVLFGVRVRCSPARRKWSGGTRQCGFESGAGTDRDEAVPCSGSATDEGSAACRAPFRIEPRAPASPAQRRAGVLSERAVATRRAGGQAVTARPSGSSARASRLRRRCSCSSASAFAAHPPGASAVASRAAAASRMPRSVLPRRAAGRRDTLSRRAGGAVRTVRAATVSARLPLTGMGLRRRRS